MRRTHLRGHTNILKRLLIHAGGFNLGLLMRHLIGIGTPRGLQDRPPAVMAAFLVFVVATRRRLAAIFAWFSFIAVARWPFSSSIITTRSPPAGPLTPGAAKGSPARLLRPTAITGGFKATEIRLRAGRGAGELLREMDWANRTKMPVWPID